MNLAAFLGLFTAFLILGICTLCKLQSSWREAVDHGACSIPAGLNDLIGTKKLIEDAVTTEVMTDPGLLPQDQEVSFAGLIPTMTKLGQCREAASIGIVPD